MATQEYSKEVNKIIDIQKVAYLVDDFNRIGLLTSEDVAAYKKKLNDNSHKAIDAFIVSIK